MTCPHCGKELAEGTRFCAYCGNAISSANPVQNSAPQPQNPQPPYTSIPQQPQNSQAPYTPMPQQPQQRPSYVPPQPHYTVPGLNQKPRYTNPIALIAAIVAIASMFMPLVTASAMGISQSVTLFQALTQSFDFLILLIILMMIAIVIMQLAKAPQVPSIVMAALSLIFMFIEVGVANETFNQVSSMGVKISYDFGFWLMILALIAVIASSPIYNAINKKKQ